IRVTAWPGLAPLGELHAPGKNLTSLHISPDGAFMATGDSDASMSLWDLRPLLGRYLVTRPLAALTPADATTINLLAAAEHLPHPTRQALKYVARVLQHRFRYDIEVADAHTILAGEFDIEIEG
ncbi:MAG: hypothetical protein GY803_18710, partial [Chloroflexi bacterium]|nr:hypothetical protein [Chloroflexota bacterium]